MKLPKLTRTQKIDLGKIIAIYKRRGVQAQHAFWVNFRHEMRTGEFSPQFEGWFNSCHIENIPLEDLTYDERHEAFKEYLDITR